MEKPAENHAGFFQGLIRQLMPNAPTGLRILDLGCGAGDMVRILCDSGYDAYGCDSESDYSLMHDYALMRQSGERVRQLSFDPYRLPFPDSMFDVVVSTQVLEHVQNKRETLLEIRRVLKPGGLTLHMFPSKWTLPIEVHLNVPLVSWMWPRVPRAWLALWALLGVHNEYQRGKSWREVLAENERFCRDAVDYRSKAELMRLFRGVFGNASSPMSLALANAHGPRGALVKGLPGSSLLAEILGVFRQRLMVARREPHQPTESEAAHEVRLDPAAVAHV